MTHRMIKNILSNTSNEVNKDNTEEICIEMSELERVAEKSSRQVTQQMICFYLKKYVGEEVSAIVTGIAEFGLFAEIQGFYISGLIHVTDLPSDRYFLDKDSNILKGKKTGRSYRLGQNILVTIANVSAEERKITLVPKYKKNK
jgi:ribonuclease R